MLYFPLPRTPSKTLLHLAHFPLSPAPTATSSARPSQALPPPSPTGPCTCLLALITPLCNHLVYLRDSSSRAMTFVWETSAPSSACHVTLAQQMLRRCLMNGDRGRKIRRERLTRHLTTDTDSEPYKAVDVFHWAEGGRGASCIISFAHI